MKHLSQWVQWTDAAFTLAMVFLCILSPWGWMVFIVLLYGFWNFAVGMSAGRDIGATVEREEH